MQAKRTLMEAATCRPCEVARRAAARSRERATSGLQVRQALQAKRGSPRCFPIRGLQLPAMLRTEVADDADDDDVRPGVAVQWLFGSSRARPVRAWAVRCWRSGKRSQRARSTCGASCSKAKFNSQTYALIQALTCANRFTHTCSHLRHNIFTHTSNPVLPPLFRQGRISCHPAPCGALFSRTC